MQVRYTNIGDEPLSLTEVKSYCYVDHSTDDTYLTALITRVREIAERSTDRSYVVKTIEYFEEDYESTTTLPYPPHGDISEILVDGVDVTASAIVTGLVQKIVTVNKAYSTGEANDQGLKVTYATVADVPDGMKPAMLKLIKDLYDNRGNSTDYNTNTLIYNFETLTSIYRI